VRSVVRLGSNISLNLRLFANLPCFDKLQNWTKFLDFFRPVQQKLRAQGVRNTYSYGWQVGTSGVGDSVLTFNAFMIAYGGVGLITEDGKLHTDDPNIKKAVIKALERLVADYKDGYESRTAINWLDNDDNNAFHIGDAHWEFPIFRPSSRKPVRRNFRTVLSGSGVYWHGSDRPARDRSYRHAQ
jgi:hypothetical protein